MHECMDVDLAVWMSDLENLKSVQKARDRVLNKFQEERQFGVAHHQAEAFILEPGLIDIWNASAPTGNVPKTNESALSPIAGDFGFCSSS